MADKALLMGINDYAHISDLRGCLEDVDNMRRLLVEHYRFPASGIRELRDRDVVRSEVRDGFNWLFDGAGAEDRLVVHFSGHGSYTEGGIDEERDELICLADMDWSDPNSYFTDNELNALTKRLPAGARLTIVLDCCHSGTGTRSIARMAREMARGRALTRLESHLGDLDIPHDGLVIVGAMPDGARSVEDLLGQSRGSADVRGQQALESMADAMVLARFAPPPDWQEGARTPRMKRRSQRPESEMNHLLLAGAKDDQTAADAYIDGRSQGAFTYHLARAARREPQRRVRLIFEEASKEMLGRYSQIPQLEGPFKESPLFAPGKSGPVVGHSSGTTLDTGAGSRIDTVLSSADPGAAVADLIRVQEKFLDTLRLLLGEGGLASAGRSSAVPAIVYVHGIGAHGKCFSKDWWKALEPHLGGRPFEKFEVVWSDLVNAARSVASRSEETAIDRAFGAIEAEMERRIEDERSALGFPEAAEGERGFITDRISLDDFPRYLTVKSIRDGAIGRFREKVDPLLAAGRTVHVISHSWGTVVAYEALRRMERDSRPSGSVGRFFTVGSALAYISIRKLLETGAKDGAKPALVDRWINIDAKQDIVGGKLGTMAVDADRLDLEPVGCGWGWRPKCAHSSYFHPDNDQVNRDIFAAEILGR